MNGAAGEPDPLSQAGFLLGRAYYMYIGMLMGVLVELNLDEHVQPGMGNVLFALYERDGQSVSEVAQRLQLSKSTMTGMVRRIKQAGLIEARADSDDARVVRLQLTALGRSLEPRCREAARRVDQILCREFNAEERVELNRLLAKMIDAMRTEAQPVSQEIDA